MAGFTKLFSDIVDSSIWNESPETCKVWVTLLALADSDGFVRGSEGWLAAKSRVSLGKVALALNKFREPDIESRTPDNDGRRIKTVEHGWMILNYTLFRDRLTAKDPHRTAYQREWLREKRSSNCHQLSTPVIDDRPASASASASVSDSEVKSKYHKDCKAIIQWLNEKSGSHFRETDKNLGFITARINEGGVDLEGIKKMIGRQCERWKNTEWADFLRPSTLFNSEKFDGYYAAKDQPAQPMTENELKALRAAEARWK